MSVVPLNSQIKDYKENVDFFKRYQCLPTLLLALESCIEINGDIGIVAESMNGLFKCNNDQFWCNENSSYIKNITDSNLLEKIKRFNENKKHSLSTIINLFTQLLPKLIDKNHIFETISYETNYLSESDYTFLYPKNNQSGDTIKKEDLSLKDTNDIFNENTLQKITEFVSENIEYDKERMKFIYEVSKEDLQYLPFSYFLKNTDFFNNYSKEIYSLSDYFSNYFSVDDQDNYEQYVEEKINLEESTVQTGNEITFVKIFLSVLFSRYLTENKKQFIASSVENILQELHSNQSFQELINQPKTSVDFIQIITNVIVVSSLLDVGCIENNILKKEDFFGMVLSNFIPQNFDEINDDEGYDIGLISTIFLFLPNELMNLALKKLNCLDCVCFDDEFFSLISKGQLFDREYEDIHKKRINYFSDYFSFIKNNQIKINLKNFVIHNINDWVIPLQSLDYINYVTEFSLFKNQSDEEMISYALELSDKGYAKDNCLLPYKFVTEFSYKFREEGVHADLHPALHSVYFMATPFPRIIKNWIIMSRSLLNYGQPFYACLFFSLFFQFEILKETLSEEDSIANNSFLIKDMLQDLSKYKSFSIVEESLSSYLSQTSNYKNVGVLGGFINSFNFKKNQDIPKPNYNLIDNEKYPKEINLTNLSESSKYYFEKGLQIINSEWYLKLGFGDFALSNFGKGIEAELKFRTQNLNYEAMLDIKSIGVHFPNIHRYNKNEIFQVPAGSLTYLLRNFEKLKYQTIAQMKKMENLYTHDQFQSFKMIASSLISKRNKYSHVENPNFIPVIDDIIKDCIIAKKELLEDGFLKILCETS